MKDELIIGILLTLPLALVFLLNPTVIFISDGWWTSSIIQTFSFPPQNPWFAGEPLAYPYYLLGFLSLFRGFASAWTLILVSSLVIQFLAVVMVFKLAKEITKSGWQSAMATVIFFTFSSFISGIVLFFDVLTKNTAFPEFLKAVHGSNYYMGMKFAGVTLPVPFFMSLEPNLQIFALALSFYALIKNKYILNGLALGLLFASNPVLGIIGCGITALYYLLGGTFSKLWQVALITFLISMPYLVSVLTSPTGSGGIIGFEAVGILTLLIFLFGYQHILKGAVLAHIGGGEGSAAYYGKKDDGKRFQSYQLPFSWLQLYTFLVCVPTLVFLKYGYLYATIPLWLSFSIFSTEWLKRQNVFLLLVFAILSLSPFLLTLGAYSIYKPEIDWAKVEYAKTLPAYGYEIECFPENESRWLHVYSSAFGRRPAYIADKQSALAYGISEEKYNERLKTYCKVCDCE